MGGKCQSGGMIVQSFDATPIACMVTGSGPALLLVHGSGGSARQYTALRPLLEAAFTVVAMDRRGHGESGDAAPYALASEAADIAAVFATIGPAFMLAHSYGAICALEAARQGAAVRGLVLYEPPVVTSQDAYFPPELLPAMRSAVAVGDGEGAIMAFARVVRGATAEQMAQMRRMPGWAERCAHASVLLRELEATADYHLDASAFAGWALPTLILRGSESPADYVATAAALLACLPGSRLGFLAGQRHGAIEAAPALVATALREFVAGQQPAG